MENLHPTAARVRDAAAALGLEIEVVAFPDGIVVDAAFVDPSACAGHLDGCHPWVSEPLTAWLDERWDGEARPFGYRVDGEDLRTVVVTRVG